MKSKLFTIIVVSFLMVTAMDVVGQVGQETKEQKLQRIRCENGETQACIGLLNKEIEQKRKEQGPKTAEKKGYFGETEVVVDHGEQGVYEKERENIRARSDGSELGIAKEYSDAGAQASANESAAAYAIDAFQNNSGDMSSIGHDPELDKQIQNAIQELVWDEDIIETRNGIQIISDKGFKSEYAKLSNEADEYNHYLAKKREAIEKFSNGEISENECNRVVSECENRKKAALETVRKLKRSVPVSSKDYEDFKSYEHGLSQYEMQLTLDINHLKEVLGCDGNCGFVKQ